MVQESLQSDCHGTAIVARLTRTLTFIVAPFVVLCYAAVYFHDITFLWQCTTLAEAVLPAPRHDCPVLSGGGDVRLTNNGLGPKVGLLMVYNPGYGLPDETLVPRLIKNRENYCAKHQCTVISTPQPNQPLTSAGQSRGPAWGKLIAMREQLETGQYDYMMYVDMDMVIMNPEISPASIINQAPPGQDFIVTSDWSGINTGIIFARNTNFTTSFLKLAYAQEQLVPTYASNGERHLFRYEQRAFHYLLNTPLWAEQGLPLYPGNYTELRRHFTSLPQCSMNSYALHPLDMKATRSQSQYVKSDFIVHMAGKNQELKGDFMRYYLSLAEEKYS